MVNLIISFIQVHTQHSPDYLPDQILEWQPIGALNPARLSVFLERFSQV